VTQPFTSGKRVGKKKRERRKTQKVQKKVQKTQAATEARATKRKAFEAEVKEAKVETRQETKQPAKNVKQAKAAKTIQSKPAKERKARIRRKHHLPVKVQRTLMIAAILLAVGLLVFVEIVRPNQDAKKYTGRLYSASQPLERCFEKLADTTGSKLFYAPDIRFDAKAADTADILRQIATCRTEIKKFDHTARQLLSLRLAGYTPTYRQAKVNQRQALDVIGQSNDVLDQYQRMTTFLAAYYKHTAAFVQYTTALSTEGDWFNNARLQKLSNQADDLRSRSVAIQQLDAPQEFEPTKNATMAMFAKAADGLDKVVSGYTYGNDFAATDGFKSIDQAVADYDGTVINLPFHQLTTSYIPQQVTQLPVKVQNLLAVDSE
jgi:hypothetical protein